MIDLNSFDRSLPTSAIPCLPTTRAASFRPSVPRTTTLPPDRPPVFLDLETRSDCDIKLGGRRYASHPSTEIASVVALIDRTMIVWTPGREPITDLASIRPEVMPEDFVTEAYGGTDVPPPLLAALQEGRDACAHNGWGFDELVWRARGLQEPIRWLDTLPWARAAGLSGKLDEIGKALFGLGKDPAGAAVVNRLSQRVDGRWVDLTNQEWQVLLRYNVQDVLLLAGLYQIVRNYNEAELLAVHRTINDRGVEFDTAVARQLLTLLNDESARLATDMETTTQGALRHRDLTRVAFLRHWLQEHGIATANLQRETVEALLEDPAVTDPAVRAVLSARLTMNGVAASKLQTALEQCHLDGRLRDLFVYCGSHTGRWTGRGVQPHNLPKPRCDVGNVSALLANVGDPAAFAAALPNGASISDAVSALLRPCFRARNGCTLVVADFSGIEARGLAWCAREDRLRELFESGGDPYCDLASQIFGRPITRADAHERSVGKIAVLGCGYAMGAEKFRNTCRQQGVDLAAVGLTAEAVVEAYRDAYPAIAGTRAPSGFGRRGGLWKAIERAAQGAVEEGRERTAGFCRFNYEDDGQILAKHLLVELPSGRVMVYRNARLVHSWNETYQYEQTQLVYDAPEQPGERTYGGLLAENVVSAISRDLLAAAMVTCEREGLPIVLHVHDEIVVEVPHAEAEASLRRLLEIMSTPPSWAAGFPIEVEGYCTERYLKSPPVGSLHGRARNGRLLD